MTEPLSPQRATRDMEKHVTVLGAFFIAFHVQEILASGILFITLVGLSMFVRGAGEVAVASAVLVGAASLLVFLGLAGLVAGVGLLKRQAWSRVLGLVLGLLNLLNLPFGTALGIYAIWVLTRDEAIELLDR